MQELLKKIYMFFLLILIFLFNFSIFSIIFFLTFW